MPPPKKKKSYPVSERIASRPVRQHFKIFFLCWLWTRCPIAAEISGSIGILLCCVFKRLFHIGIWTFCPICEASCEKTFPPSIHVSHISLLGGGGGGSASTATDFEADRWPETGDFFLALIYNPSIRNDEYNYFPLSNQCNTWKYKLKVGLNKQIKIIK